MSRAAGARLFVAVDLPGVVRDGLTGWARDARRGRTEMRLLDSELLHVTVCFLGTRPLEDVDPVAGVLSGQARPLAELGLGAPVWLPPRRPRALAVEVRDDDGALASLVRDVTARLAGALDWSPERRRHRPHVTVARMREGRAPRERALAPTPALRFAAEALTLYRSQLRPSGASYDPLVRIELADVEPA